MKTKQNGQWDPLMPKRLAPAFDYFQDRAMYLFAPELLESSLLFNLATAIQTRNVRIKREQNHGHKLVVPNFYALIMANSGSGKNFSFSLTSEPFQRIFTSFTQRVSEFTESTDNHDDKNELLPQYIHIRSPFVPAASSEQGIQKAAQTINDMGTSFSVSIFEDELADRMGSLGSIFSKLKTGFDTGESVGPVNVSAGGANYFTVNDVCFNSLMMGSPGIFEQLPKLKEQLLGFLITGITRRSFIYYNTSYKKSENRNHNFDTMDAAGIQLATDYFDELLSFIRNMEDIVFPANVYRKLIQYDIDKEVLREQSESLLSEDLGSPAKIERLAALIAVLDLSQTVTEDHLLYAISYTERVDETAEKAIRVKPTYELIYDKLYSRGFISQTDLVREIKQVTNVKRLEEEMELTRQLATELGNSIVSHNTNGIVKYKMEKLSATQDNKVVISINPNPDTTASTGWIRKEGKFENLHRIVCGEKSVRYSAGTFVGGHITNANYIKEGNLIIIDVDDGMTIEEAKSLFKSTKYLIATTRSHQILKNDKIVDRFRLIIPTTSKFHLSPEVYSQMYENIMNALGMEIADMACRNASRWYYPNKTGEYWYNEDPNAEMLDIRAFIPDSSEQIETKKNVNKFMASDDNHCYDEDKSERQKAGMIRWMLANTVNGNRAVNMFKYAMFLKERDMDIENGLRGFNSMLSEPLNEGELMQTARSAERR